MRTLLLLSCALSGCGANHYLKQIVGPMNYAIQQGDYGKAKALAAQGYDLNSPPTPTQQPALAQALLYQAPNDFIVFLLDHGAKPSPALFGAIGCKLPAGYQVTVGKFADMPYSCGEPVDAVKLLLDRGADPNSRDPGSGVTPLMSAASLGHLATADLLLSRGADLKARSNSGLRPVMYALAQRRSAVVESFMSKGDRVSPDEAALSAKLGVLCTREEGVKTGYAVVNQSTEDQARDAHLPEVAKLCMELSPDFTNGYMAGVDQWHAEITQQFNTELRSSLLGLFQAADGIWGLRSRLDLGVPGSAAAQALDAVSGSVQPPQTGK